jgi:hypothetical protein
MKPELYAVIRLIVNRGGALSGMEGVEDGPGGGDWERVKDASLLF